ncbi:MAG: 50S ribosomal protein L29 [Candidatus Marinimicrobia bacterium]|nr:50S ribosomal protein L29 [Candidatus Neomarinimicrobiota bacterium]MDD5581856.1 50S ribosomal protein L29 [Candidatus Neomarinimicrobiota bacterium]
MLSKIELKELTQEEAEIKLRDNKDALMNLKFQHKLQQLNNPQEIKKIKREIAQLKTILHEYKLGKR